MEEVYVNSALCVFRINLGAANCFLRGRKANNFQGKFSQIESLIESFKLLHMKKLKNSQSIALPKVQIRQYKLTLPYENWD